MGEEDRDPDVRVRFTRRSGPGQWRDADRDDDAEEELADHQLRKQPVRSTQVVLIARFEQGGDASGDRRNGVVRVQEPVRDRLLGHGAGILLTQETAGSPVIPEVDTAWSSMCASPVLPHVLARACPLRVRHL